MLKELGAKKVVSVAKRDRQAYLLKKIGADDTIYPEREIAEKTGIKYNAKNIFDLIQITEEYAIYEIPVLVSWIGKTIQEVDVRKNYHVNIIVVKNGDRVTGAPGANYKFVENDHIMILGTQHDVFKLANKT
jgi:trk system potassium uptake protein TrkA